MEKPIEKNVCIYCKKIIKDPRNGGFYKIPRDGGYTEEHFCWKCHFGKKK